MPFGQEAADVADAIDAVNTAASDKSALGTVEEGLPTLGPPDVSMAPNFGHPMFAASPEGKDQQAMAAHNAAVAALGWGIAPAIGIVGPAGYGFGLAGTPGTPNTAVSQGIAQNAADAYSDSQMNDSTGYGYGINAGQAPAGTSAASSDTGYGYGANLGGPAPAAAPGSIAAGLAEAQGYSDAVSAPMGYGYGMNLGQTTSADNLGTSDDASVAQGAPNGFTVSAPTEADISGMPAADTSADTANLGNTGTTDGDLGGEGATGATGQAGNVGGGVGIGPGGDGDGW